MTITTQIENQTYNISLDASGDVDIAVNGIWAGRGTWDGQIECAAVLSEDVYSAIEDAIAEALDN